MFKPKYNKGSRQLTFNIDAEIINTREGDLVTGLRGKDLDDVSLFIDDAVQPSPPDPTDCFPNCDRRDLGEQKMAGIRSARPSFTSSNLMKADLSYAYLPGASMYRADMQGVNLKNAVVFGAEFTEANLEGAILTSSNIKFNNFRLANLTNASLDKTIMNNSDFQNAKLENSSLVDAQAGRANFKSDKLHWSRFHKRIF